ncbi:rCG40979 [Rattus norvegicus]|uniref:RCG40979 n=1 Tax=Rattus norvegicus TaxID=10116 RepID=A6MGV9_RAT|nr:rCG40979 [Rattus norvegicus]
MVMEARDLEPMTRCNEHSQVKLLLMHLLNPSALSARCCLPEEGVGPPSGVLRSVFL